ncbi:MAG: hypothetical protein KOO60_13905, partial [Gemmatimonadales bacterium]|nr:hypothetical protein [Gemmatimonadales bacterium]
MNFNILIFELRRQMRQPAMYVYFLLFALMGFMGVWRASVGRGLLAKLTLAGRGNIEADAPYAIYYYITMLSTFGLIIAMAWFGNAASRDFKFRAHSLFYSYPLGKFAYLGGRFGGALAGILFVASGIGFGGLIAAVSPGADPAGIGSLNVMGFIQPYFISILPNFFLAGALFFSIAILSRQFSSVWAGLIGIVTLHLVGQGLAQTDSKLFAALLDPSGLVATRMTFQYWSISQKNEFLMPLTGVLLLNRLLWTAVAAAIWAFTWRRFSFAVPEVSGSGMQEIPEPGIPESKFRPSGIVSELQTVKSFSPWAHVGCMFHLIMDDFGFLTRRKSFYFVVALGLGLVLTIAYNNVGLVRGTQTFPVTSQILSALCRNLYFLGVLVALYCSSALVWRERDALVHEISGVLPVPRWVPLFSKIVAMSLVQ